MRNTPIFKSCVLSVACFALLSGCTMIPELAKPETVAPLRYPEGPAYDPDLVSAADDQAELGEIAWQNYYQDETLRKLIKTGLDNNNDLRRAALRIAEARALYGIERSSLFPDISADSTFRRQKSDATSNASSLGGGSFIAQNYTVNLGITAYELDFFGRVRSLKEAALNDYLATTLASQSVRITMISDIAAVYTSLRANQALLALAEETLQTRQESYDIIKKRAQEGVSTDLDLTQAETLLLQTRVDLSRFITAIAQDQNALRLLLGTPETMPSLEASFKADSDAHPEAEDSHEALGEIIRDVPVGLPSALLSSRPDIIEAEYQLRSANADIGAARAAFFPRIALTTTGGYSSSEFQSLFNNASQIWAFSPQISIPIFTGGRLKNNLDLAEIRKEIAIIDYESAIETAFREVSDALSAAGTFDERLQSQQSLVDAAQRRADLSNRRYEAGVENYLAVLDAKRALYEAQQSEIQIRRQKLTNVINLYKSLGGGLEREHNPDTAKRSKN